MTVELEDPKPEVRVFDLQKMLQCASVKLWLQNFNSVATKDSYEFQFSNFLRWLWYAKKIQMTPDEILDDHNKCLASQDKRVRAHWSYLCIEFARDSKMPEGYQETKWRGQADLGYSSKIQARTAIISFFEYNDLALQPVKSQRIEQTEKEDLAPITLSNLRLAIKDVPLEFLSALLMILHTGVRIGDLFNSINKLWPTINEQIKKKKVILKIKTKDAEFIREVPWSEMGTKAVCVPLVGMTPTGELFRYFCLAGTDAIEALEKHMKQQGDSPEGDNRIWRYDRTLLQKKIHTFAIAKGLMKKDRGNTKGGRRYPYYLHRIRKIFKTTCMLRGVAPTDSEFLVGHRGGIEKIYDERHLSHPETFVAEFLKAEPILDIISNPDWTTPDLVAKFIKRYDPKWRPPPLKGQF